KGQRNGPCGGSFEGWCEVYPKEKKCIYVRVYDRMKSDGTEDQLGAYHVPPVNYDLLWTSSWLNFYMGRDHSAKRLGIEPPAKK
ncbi:MAG: methylenetetrahydrofolate reductase C-terminal domain-containing protein, partial [Deferrisomatales bacterium]|nr:methylenetetrahydrofolate reductase C-terminal domain-containing protein [Deferrisomatales bacterium]